MAAPGPPHGFNVLANSLHTTGQRFERSAAYPLVTVADLTQQLQQMLEQQQQQFEQLQQQLQQQIQQQQQSEQQFQQQFQQQLQQQSEQQLQQQSEQQLQQQSQQQQQFQQQLLENIRQRCTYKLAVTLSSTATHCCCSLTVWGSATHHCVLCSESRKQARYANSFAVSNTMLEGLRNGNGAAPALWPTDARVTPEQVRKMPGDQVDSILQHYSLSTDGPVQVRRRKLLNYLGVRS